jgi:acyl carrier protein
MSKHLRARKLVADALDQPIEDVPEDARVGSIRAWDSLGHVRVIMAIESRLGRPMQALDVAGLRSVADITNLIGDTA